MAGKPSSTERSANRFALFDAGTGTDRRFGSDHAATAHDRRRFDDAAPADPAAVDHRTGTDDDVIVDEQFIVRQQVQDRVLEDLYPGADADGPCESPMILTPALMRVFSPTTTSPVISAESNSSVPAPIDGVLSP